MSVSKRPISDFQELETAADDSDEIHCDLPEEQQFFANTEEFLTCQIGGQSLADCWPQMSEVAVWSVQFDSLEEFVQAIKDGCDIKFSLAGRQYSLGQSSERKVYRQLAWRLEKGGQMKVEKFADLKQLLAFEIAGQSLGKQWSAMKNVDYG